MLIVIALQPVLVLLLIYFMNSVLRLALFAERPSCGGVKSSPSLNVLGI